MCRIIILNWLFMFEILWRVITLHGILLCTWRTSSLQSDRFSVCPEQGRAVKRKSDGHVRCTCRGVCKNNLCGCRKTGSKCSKDCRCDHSACQNLEVSFYFYKLFSSLLLYRNCKIYSPTHLRWVYFCKRVNRNLLQSVTKFCFIEA